MAIIARDRRDIDGAVAMCKKSIELNSNYAIAHNGLAYLYNVKGEFKLAEKHLEISIKNSTDVSKVSINLGITNLYLENKEEAKKCFSDAITNGENFYGASGWAKVVIGETQSGLSDIKNALMRQDYISDVQDIFDWTLLASKTPNPPEGVMHLLEFIKNEPIFKKLLASDPKR